MERHSHRIIIAVTERHLNTIKRESIYKWIRLRIRIPGRRRVKVGANEILEGVQFDGSSA